MSLTITLILELFICFSFNLLDLNSVCKNDELVCEKEKQSPTPLKTSMQNYSTLDTKGNKCNKR